MTLSVIFAILYSAFLFLAAWYFLGAIFCVYRMFLEVKPGGNIIANLFPYLLGLIPGLLTPAGELLREKFVKKIIVSVINVLLAMSVLAFA